MTSACSGPGSTPNLRHIMLFDQVVRRGSVSGAARAAHLSQPAVTQAVAQVEAALGARLLHRSYSGLELTGAGRGAAQRVDRALQMLRAALGAVRTRSADAVDADALRGITSTQLKALIAVVEEGAFARAARRAGRARTAVHRAARQLEKSLGTELFEVTSFGVRPTREAEKLALRTRLAFAEIDQAQAEVAAARGTRRGSADVLVGALRDPIPYQDIVQEHLFDDPLAIIVGARHPLAGRGAPTLAALSRFAWIAPRRDSPLRRHFDALVGRLDGRRAVAPIECNSLIAARSMLLASDRVMLLSEHQIHHELESRQLVALPHPFGDVTRSIGLTVRRDWWPTEVQAQLVEGLRRHARAVAASSSATAGAKRVLGKLQPQREQAQD